jgi:hypothetical protein
VVFRERARGCASSGARERITLGEEPNVVLIKRVLADGNRVPLSRLTNPLDIYVITEDRIEGPVKAYAYITRGQVYIVKRCPTR